MKDLSTDAGGGSDDDEIPEGPVVDENVHVVIHEKDSNTNLLKNTGTTLKTNTTYQVLLWSDKNGNGTYDAGENVTDQYDYRWKFVGTSKIAGTGTGGIVNESWNDKDLVIPVTNVEAKAAFEGAEGGVTVGSDGVEALVCPSTTNANKLSSTYHSPRGVVFSTYFSSCALSKVG